MEVLGRALIDARGNRVDREVKAPRQTAELTSPCPLLLGLLSAPGVVHQDLTEMMASPLLAGLRSGTISSGQSRAAPQTMETLLVPDAPCLLLPGLRPAPSVALQDLTPVTSSPLLAGLLTGGGAAGRRLLPRAQGKAREDRQGFDCYSACSTRLGSRRSSDTSASDLSDTF